jgi:hypothetical protein
VSTDFIARLERVRDDQRSDLALLLAPSIDRLPPVIQRFDEPFLPYSKAVIDATGDLVCAYVFDLASYLALGAAGAIALERAIDYVGTDVITILHGPFTGQRFAQLTDESAFGVDAVTLVGSQHIAAYTSRSDRSAFVVRMGTPQILDAPHNAGIYWQDAGLFTMRGRSGAVVSIRLLDESSVSTRRGGDITAELRNEVEKRRDEYAGG